MSNIVLFRQHRVDGGIHTGVDVDGESWEYYDRGSDKHDPALVWYVDLRAQGDDLPTNSEDARQWLLDNEPLVNATYRQLAERLEVGVDPGHLAAASGADPGPRGHSSCRSLFSCGGFRQGRWEKPVEEIQSHWKEYLDRLPQVQHQ